MLPQRKNDSDVWIPFLSRRRQTRPNQDEARIANLAHELAVSDVYCVMFPHKYQNGNRVLQHWDRDVDNETYTQVRYDAALSIDGKPMFLEVERGNHPILPAFDKNGDKPKFVESYYLNSLNFKIDRYVKYFQENGYKPFTVLITVEDWSMGVYDADRTVRLFTSVKELVSRYRREAHVTEITFAVALHRHVIGDKDHTPGEIHHEVMGDPFGKVWESPSHEGIVSLRDI